MPLPNIDHYGYGITNRDDLQENIVYVNSGPEYVIPHLQPGDVVRLQRWGKSYPQIILEVIENNGDYVTAVDDKGKEFDMWATYVSNLETSSWLRRDGKSEGEITRLTILELK